MDENIDKLFECNGITDLLVPKYGWKAKLDLKHKEKCRPFTLPRLSQVYGFINFSLRYLRHIYLPNRKAGKKPFIDCLNQEPWKPIYGVPMGGIGAGAINRGFKGEFCRYSLVPGLYDYHVVDANQFIVTVRRRGATVYQQVLSVHRPPTDSPLNCWNWQFPASRAAYVGLFPQAWTVYDIPEQKIKLLCKQMSPVIPHDYKDSCLPLCLFDWIVVNYGKESVSVTITLVIKNGFGENSNAHNGISTSVISDLSFEGVTMLQKIEGMGLCYGLGVAKNPEVSVSTCSGFMLEGIKECGDSIGPKEFWEYLMSTGNLSELSSNEINVHRDTIIGACAQITVAGLSSCSSVRFVYVWHMPLVHFRSSEVLYNRRYARWFESNNLNKGVHQLIDYAMSNGHVWHQKIQDWQRPILEDSRFPDWYKSAIFNELYFMVDGGTVWLDRIDDKCLISSNDLPSIARQKHHEEFGIFGYLEGHEYRMYNTYDVHHYSSWALIMLWPKIQETIQYDIADATRSSDPTLRLYLHTGDIEARSAAYCPPHDAGDPEDEPFVKYNAYVMYNTDNWKDLGPKFVLQVYRDWKILKNEMYLQYMLPIVMEVMKHCMKCDKDGDGVIENSGHADQTYDAWTVKGISAYTGGLWLGALYGACEMAQHDGIEHGVYRDALLRGKSSYESKLWTGSYYRYDEHNSVIMADQLCGHWYLKSVGVPDNEVFDKEKVISALKTIFQKNCLSICDGNMGAVNGCYPNGRMVITSVQSEEFWVGVNYSLAATMILEGRTDDAWKLTKGVYQTVYERYGLQYQTPEAYFENCRYRSLGYMRPLAIWAMQHAFDHPL